jgi:hypothetical protein
MRYRLPSSTGMRSRIQRVLPSFESRTVSTRGWPMIART